MKNLPKWEFILLLNVHGFITIVALLGSYFVLRAFHKFRNLRTASNNILVSLSIADGLLAIPLILDIIHLCLKYSDTDCSRILKEVYGTITLFLLSVIVLHLTLLSSERFIAIKFALRYQAIVTKRRARIVSIAMWLWALVVNVAVPEVLQRATGKDFKKLRRQMRANNNTSQVLHIRWHLVFQAVSMFLVPLLIILCSYTYIFIVSYKQRQHVREQGRDVPGMPTIKHERCPHSRHCCSAVSTQYHPYAGCDFPPSLLWHITQRPLSSKAIEANPLRRGHVCECHMHPSYLRMEK